MKNRPETEGSFEVVRVFVGSDVWQHRYGAEAALMASIEQNTSGPVEVVFMRANPTLGGDWAIAAAYSAGVWNCRCQPGDVYPSRGARGCGGWATPFTGFRWAVPELCGFEGHAIYQDADMIDVGDMRELWEMGRNSSKPVYLSQRKSCVMVLDNAAFREIEWWPAIEKQREGVMTMYDLLDRLQREGHVDGSMPRTWNYPDAFHEGVFVCHYTNARTQPWGPYRHRFGQRPHPNRGAVELWQHYYEMAAARGSVPEHGGEDFAPHDERAQPERRKHRA